MAHRGDGKVRGDPIDRFGIQRHTLTHSLTHTQYRCRQSTRAAFTEYARVHVRMCAYMQTHTSTPIFSRTLTSFLCVCASRRGCACVCACVCVCVRVCVCACVNMHFSGTPTFDVVFISNVFHITPWACTVGACAGFTTLLVNESTRAPPGRTALGC